MQILIGLAALGGMIAGVFFIAFLIDAACERRLKAEMITAVGWLMFLPTWVRIKWTFWKLRRY